MSRTIKLTFVTDLNQVAVMSIPRAKSGLSGEVEAVKTAMDRIIAAQIVNMTAGAPVARKKAEVIEVSTREYDLSE